MQEKDDLLAFAAWLEANVVPGGVVSAVPIAPYAMLQQAEQHDRTLAFVAANRLKVGCEGSFLVGAYLAGWLLA
jgi:hypothetical protein